MKSAVNKHYGLSAVSLSFRHFITGKAFKIISSLAILILLARILNTDEYAVYISFQGIIVLIGLISTIGIQPVLFRYLPELRSTENNLMMYRMLWVGVFLRALIVGLLFFLAVQFLPFIAEKFNLTQWQWLMVPYFIIGIFHFTTLTLSQSLESLLWQKQAQYTLAAGSMLKLMLLLAAAALNHLDLLTLVIIEGISEALMLTALVYFGFRRWQADEYRDTGDLGWWKQNVRRVVRYGFFGCLVSQTRVLYGSAPNRLLTAYFMPVGEVAVLGVADSIIKLARRFMPTRMLVSMVRPIFMARFSSDGDFQSLVRMSNLVYRVNLSVLILPITLLFVVGMPLFDWLTAGKYGIAAPLLGGFLCIMIAEGMRTLLELLVQAVEKNHIFLISNLFQSASLFLAIPLFPVIGLWALVVANLSGTVMANIIIIIWLKRIGYSFHLDKLLSLQIIFYGIISGLLGWWSLQLWGSFILSTAVICLAYALLNLVLAPMRAEEKDQILRLLKKSFARKKKVPV